MKIVIKVFLISIVLAIYTESYSQPTKAVKVYNEGFAEFNKNNLDVAFGKFNEALQIYSEYKSAYNGRGMVHLRKENWDEAIKDFNEAIRIDHEFATAYNNRGYAQLKKKEYRKAINDITQALALKRDSELGYLTRGRAYKAIKQFDSALIDFSTVIKMKPDKDHGYLWRAGVYFEQEQYNKAVSDYTESIRLNPKNGETFNLRAISYKMSGNYDKAILDFDAAITINPEKGNYYSNIISSLVRTSQFDKAKEYYKRYLDKSLSELNKSEEKVYAYYMNAATEDIPSKKYEQALIALNIAANEYGNESKKLSKSRYTNILALKGYVLEKMERFEDAQAIYEQTLAINTHQPDVLQALSNIRNTLLEISKKDKTPPEIELISPQTSRSFEIESDKGGTQFIGRAQDISGIAEVRINNHPVARLEEDGLFISQQVLRSGPNEIVITAKDKQGNETSKTFMITGAITTKHNSNPDIALLTDKPQRYYAILIAEKDYQDASIPNLQNPVRDAQELRNILETQYGFNESQIDTLFNRSREDIMQSIVQRCNTLTENDNLVIFYAGHGTAEKDKYGDVDGYWIPVSARKGVTSTYISAEDINKALKRSSAKHILIIADACFSGAFTRQLPADAGKAIQKQYKVPSRKVMASGNLEPVPDNSRFLFYLKKSLMENKEKYVSAKDLFDSFYKAIINNSENLPQYAAIKNVGDEGGEFVFIRK